MAEQTPLYEHDCKYCVYLGTMNEHDLYYHPHSDEWGRETVIARYSSDGPDYISGMTFSRDYTNAITGETSPGVPELVEARERAERMGLREAS